MLMHKLLLICILRYRAVAILMNQIGRKTALVSLCIHCDSGSDEAGQSVVDSALFRE